jgi:hypothetical protein
LHSAFPAPPHRRPVTRQHQLQLSCTFRRPTCRRASVLRSYGSA